MSNLSDYEVDDLGTQNDGEAVATAVDGVVAADAPVVATSVEGEAPKEEPKHKGGYQRKIERLERQLEQALSLVQRVAPTQQAAPIPQPVVTGKPDPDSYETFNEYIEALTDYKLGQARAEAQAEAQIARKQEHQTKVQSAFQTRYQDAVKAHPDFEALYEETADDVPFTDAMRESVLESDRGGDLMHYFLKNPEDAKRIAALSPVSAAREIGKLEARFETAPKPNATKAPAPPSPVKGTPIKPPAKDDKDYELY